MFADYPHPFSRRDDARLRTSIQPKTTERRLWVSGRVNELRVQIEEGKCIHPLACPTQFKHGSLAHASWLYTNLRLDTDIINSACGFSSFAMPTNGDDARARFQLAAGQSAYMMDIGGISTVEAIEHLAYIFGESKESKQNESIAYVCHF